MQPPPLPAELSVHLPFLMAKAHHRIFALFHPRISRFGILGRHFGLLMLLKKRGPQRQVDLSEALVFDRTTMMKLVDDLERLGFATRERDADDRRAYRVTLTERGAQVIEEILPLVQETERAFFAPLSDDERETLRALLVRLLTSAPIPDPAPPDCATPPSAQPS